MNIVVILAGGVGRRYGGNVPKQYLKLKGKEVLWYSINAAKNCNVIDKIIVVCDKQYQKRISAEYDVEVCDGGNTRNISIFNALQYIIQNNYPCEKIVFLDSARPLIQSSLIDNYICILDDYDCVITGQKITDSLGKYGTHYVNREDYYLIQTPEACKFRLLSNSFDKDSGKTAICQLMPDNSTLYVSFNMKNNMKITYNGDINYIEQFVEQ